MSSIFVECVVATASELVASSTSGVAKGGAKRAMAPHEILMTKLLSL